MSVMTTRVGPLVVTHAILGNGEVTTITDTLNPDLNLSVNGKSMVLSIRYAANYARLRYLEWSSAPLIGKKGI